MESSDDLCELKTEAAETKVLEHTSYIQTTNLSYRQNQTRLTGNVGRSTTASGGGGGCVLTDCRGALTTGSSTNKVTGLIWNDARNWHSTHPGSTSEPLVPVKRNAIGVVVSRRAARMSGLRTTVRRTSFGQDATNWAAASWASPVTGWSFTASKWSPGWSRGSSAFQLDNTVGWSSRAWLAPLSGTTPRT